jgi:hypothetical protein
MARRRRGRKNKNTHTKMAKIIFPKPGKKGAFGETLVPADSVESEIQKRREALKDAE